MSSINTGDRVLFPWRLAPLVLYLLAIFAGGALPQSPASGPGSDKWLHLLVFAGLTPVLWFSLRAQGWLAHSAGFRRPSGLSAWTLAKGSVFRQWAMCAIGATGVGALLELWQLLWPHRSAEWLDLAFDAIGAVLGSILLGLVWVYWSRYHSTNAHRHH